jgi:hypothetical protein
MQLPKEIRSWTALRDERIKHLPCLRIIGRDGWYDDGNCKAHIALKYRTQVNVS